MEQLVGNILGVDKVVFDLDRKLPERRTEFVKFCRVVKRLTSENDPVSSSAALEQIRSSLLSAKRPRGREELALLFVQNLVFDLLAHGWPISVEGSKVEMWCPPAETETPIAAKERTRKAHLIERNIRLREEPVSEFIRRMEHRRLTERGWHSIFSLMREGRDLAKKLRVPAETADESAKDESLAITISPYLQFVDGDNICEHTGLLLRDIWRYFRLTWVNVHKSLPGRSIMILVRDRSAPNHPVIGIAALGSSVVQSSIRDKWIGWDAKTFTERLTSNSSTKMAKWVLESLRSAIADIYRKDLQSEGICTATDIRYPGDFVIQKLRAEAARAIVEHRRFPRAAHHKSKQASASRNIDWSHQARTSLFRAKRCRTLATLLTIRKVFQAHDFNRATGRQFKKALDSEVVRSAVGQFVRQIKAKRVGVNMMDIIVCGAIPPYNALLGGKLVCMLLTSPEVTHYYSDKYSNQVSVIASSMKGGVVIRTPRLVLLGTTSLYAVGSSQYNRVRIPANEIGGRLDERIEYTELGLSEGYGSFHFSSTTLELMNALLARAKEGRRVNSIFGEGVNPLMRKIREALELVGLNSDPILRHGKRRVVYGVALARNLGDVLMGVSDLPKYILPQSAPERRTQMISAYWRRRWLSGRITKPGILDEVAKHSLAYPIKHGARVPLQLPDNDSEFTLLPAPNWQYK